MTLFFFGFAPRSRGTTKLAIQTPVGELEPVEPSRFTVYVHRAFHPMYSLISSIFGLLVAIASFPPGHYVHTSASGLMTRPASDGVLPFRTPGLAFVLRKGRRLSSEVISKLEDAGFAAMEYQGRSVWLKDNATKGDFLLASGERDIDPTGPSPARYCNSNSFQAFLVLRSFTTRICELFHYLAMEGAPYAVASQKKNSETKAPYVNAQDTQEEDVAMQESSTFEFLKPTATALSNGNDNRFKALTGFTFSSDGLSVTSSGALRSLGSVKAGFITPLHGESLKSHGMIFKFHPQLALPDTNLIGDVLGRRFLAGLGDDLEEQADNLDLLKSGLSALRLTRLGDEFTHLYRCLDLAIECNAGCIPIFSRSLYEGCVISGGPGATLIRNGDKFPFVSVTTLKQDMLTVSTHANALQRIARLVPVANADSIRSVESMVALREICLTLVLTQSQRDEIIRNAADLEFSTDDLVINPANLKRCFAVISDLANLDYTDPIGRMSLFETDPVIVALSMFGEKTAPSWDVPNGTQCSLKRGSPPSPPVDTRKKGSLGEISDAAWVMTIRQTDLFSAADEFRRMASTLVYRSTSSVLAKKVGHRVFGRDRMGEFWAQMREALRSVNPNAEYEEAGSSLKRGLSDSPSTIQGGDGSSKRRRMAF